MIKGSIIQGGGGSRWGCDFAYTTPDGVNRIYLVESSSGEVYHFDGSKEEWIEEYGEDGLPNYYFEETYGYKDWDEAWKNLTKS